jgi:membrane protease subunit (stomatin/prohibitin family)
MRESCDMLGDEKEANQGAAANGLSAVRSSVAGNRERTVRSTATVEAVAELCR